MIIEEEFDEQKASSSASVRSYELVIDGFHCPPDVVKDITPMEFEEMVNLFQKYDTNLGGTIDKFECRQILHDLEIETTEDKVDALIEAADADGTGEISFEEFCRFIHGLKQGNEKFKGFADLLEQVQSTPLGELERQAAMRKLKLSFQTVMIREESMGDPIHIIELSIAGMWPEVVDGKAVETYKVRKFQGMGKNAREAKYQAAAKGTMSLTKVLPGAVYPDGIIPDEWLHWAGQNLQRGVDPVTVVNILTTKGFRPHRNIVFMQRIISWMLFDEWLYKNPSFDPNIGERRILQEEFRAWVRMCVRHGIDGDIVLSMLEDRGIPLSAEFTHFAQQLRGNELGPLIDAGSTPKFLDFWVACEEGYDEIVRVYCESGADVNEEALGRQTSEALRPLALAARRGHTKVVKVLLQKGADPNLVDRRGRAPLHHGAYHGSTEACQLLLEQGAELYLRDNQGNTAMHLSAMNNYTDTLDMLIEVGMDYVRQIFTDIIPVKDRYTFAQLTSDVFANLPKEKLSVFETHRFEKSWLGDAVEMFLSKVDPMPKKKLPLPNNPEIIQDVLNRFDPRPETGIFLYKGVNRDEIFVPTVMGSMELGVMIRYVFRQSVLDSINNWKRTPLHVACDVNQIRSHERIISSLLDKHGVNVNLRDRHSRRPIDLLVVNKRFGSTPSATQQREEILTEARAKVLSLVSAEALEADRREAEERQELILEDCIRRAENMSMRLWEATRAAAIKWGEIVHYKRFIDPDTKNLFYFRELQAGEHPDEPVNYSWYLPDMVLVKNKYDRMLGFTFQCRLLSDHMRTVGQWDMFRCRDTGIDYYYDPHREILRFTPPDEAIWFSILRRSEKGELLGYGDEWQRITDSDGNLFYKNRVTGVCEWDRPLEAVEVPNKLKFCTSFFHKDKNIVQPWYTCDTCNEKWRHSQQGEKGGNGLLKICAPCMLRCHMLRGHKGVRLVVTSAVRCICCKACDVAECGPCLGLIPTKEQVRVLRKADKYNIEVFRRRTRDQHCPPVFALVPPVWPDGRPKRLSGWRLCRRPPVFGLDKLGGETSTDGDEQQNSHQGSRRNSHASQKGILAANAAAVVPVDQQRKGSVGIVGPSSSDDKLQAVGSGNNQSSTAWEAKTARSSSHSNNSKDVVNRKHSDSAGAEGAESEPSDAYKLLTQSSVDFGDDEPADSATEDPTAATSVTVTDSTSSPTSKGLPSASDIAKSGVLGRRKSVEKARRDSEAAKMERQEKATEERRASRRRSSNISERAIENAKEDMLKKRRSSLGSSSSAHDGVPKSSRSDRPVDENNDNNINNQVTALTDRPKSAASSVSGADTDEEGEDGTHREKKPIVKSNRRRSSLGDRTDRPINELVFAQPRKDFKFRRPPGLPPGWIEVVDPEEPEEIPVGARVLVEPGGAGIRDRGPEKKYGNVLERLRKGVYRVRYEWEWDEEMEAAEQARKKAKEERRKAWEAEQERKRHEKRALKAQKRLEEAGSDDEEQSKPQSDSDSDSDSEESYSSESSEENFLGREEVVGRHRIETILRPTFFCNVEEGLCAWTVDDARNNPFRSSAITLHGAQWVDLYERSVTRRLFFEQDKEEMHHLLSDALFYADLNIKERELAIVRIQTWYRQRRCKPLPERLGEWISSAYAFDCTPTKPADIILAERKLAGWAFLRRRSDDMGGFRCVDNIYWEEYQDRLTFEKFYWAEEDWNHYRWDKPKIPENVVKREILPEGQEMLYPFPGDIRPQLGVITKVRFDDQTGEELYDIEKKGKGGVKVRWVKRDLLTLPPRSLDEIVLARMERQWVKQLRQARFADERRAKRERQLRIQADIAAKRAIIERNNKKRRGGNMGDTALAVTKAVSSAAAIDQLQELEAAAAAAEVALAEIDGDGPSSGGGDKEEKDMGASTVAKGPALIEARSRRGALEMFEIEEEKQAAENAEREQRVKEALDEIKRNGAGNLSRSEILMAARTLELQHKIDAAIERRNKRNEAVNLRKKAEIERQRNAEESLREQESMVSTPRSLSRRILVRRMHFAMQRQDDGFMVCEWGCGDWLKSGQATVEHQLKYCTRRIITCTLGCGLKMTEEAWLRPLETPLSAEEKEEKRLRQKRKDAESHQHVTTIQENHELNECPRRLVPCPLQCLEFVHANELADHMELLCPKRPAKPISCRLGCGAVFGGRVEKMIEAEEERYEHEQEECEFRQVRCTWQFPDGAFCGAMMSAKDRDKHRDYHISLLGINDYTVAGTYMYTVPARVTRLKVQVWGGGGGSGFFKNRKAGSGGGGAFVEAVIAVKPFDVLEIVVGSGGLGGTAGTFIDERVDINALREETVARRRRQMFMSLEERIADNRVLAEADDERRRAERERLSREMQEVIEEAKRKGVKFEEDADPVPGLMIDPARGIALGGRPGGGRGYGGIGLWASGGGGGYSIVSKRTPRGNEVLLVAGGGGGGGSMPGVPGGGLNGALPGTRVQPRNGRTGYADRGGEGGESGAIHNSAWGACDGVQWQGGNGSEFGGGGGGGFFGGGGGGTTPGVSGGGGGGSSFVYHARTLDHLVILGSGPDPGGLQHDPPVAAGIGVWDKPGGYAGQGGIGTDTMTKAGNSGAVRILKPGFY